MNFSFRQLRAFLAVARETSFTKASERMHITQAGLSAMIRDLESQVGCALFERTTRAVRLTAAGERLLPVAQRTVQDLNDAFDELNVLETRANDRLRLGVTPLMAASVVPEALNRFAELEPEVHVDVVDLDRALIQQGVERGELDAGFGAFFTRVSGIRREVIFPAQLVLAVAGSDAAAGKRRVHWRHLDPDTMISLPQENPIQRLVDSQLRPRRPEHAAARVVTHLETVLALVESGLGHAVVPSFAIPACRRWRVSLIPIAPVVSLDYFCITRSGRPGSSLMARFTEVFRSVAQAS